MSFFKKKLTPRVAYYIVFASLVIWSLFAFVTIHELSAKQSEYAKLINISGKQRMLSQRSALTVATLGHGDTLERREALGKALNALSQNHQYILAHLPSDKISKLYYDEPHSINKKLQEYIEYIGNYDPKTDDNHELLYKRASATLLELDNAVSAFQEESIVFVNQFGFLEKFILGGSLATILLEAIFLILPILKRAERHATEIEEKKLELESILSTSKDGIAILDLNGVFTFANNSFLDTLGYGADELIGEGYSIVYPDDIFKKIENVSSGGVVENIEKIHFTKNREKVILSMSIAMMPDFRHILISTKNVTAAKRLERQNLEYMKLIDENIINSTTDLSGKITYVSEAFCRVSGYSKEELIGASHSITRHPDMPKEFFAEMWRQLRADQSWEGEIKNSTKNGGFYWVKTNISPIFDEDGKKCGYAAVRQDITDKKMIEQISVTDKLTGLYNRFKLDEMFILEYERAARYGSVFSIIMMDIDHFKEVNDVYGHLVGDSVLSEIGAILKGNTRKTDTVGRWGGEEFLIIAPDNNTSEAAKLAEKLRRTVESHIFKEIGAKTISLGVSSYKLGDKADDILKRADEALYYAKAKGRNRVEKL